MTFSGLTVGMLLLSFLTVFKVVSSDPCSKSEFTCHDGSCIKLKLKCDEDPDCPDGSDELPLVCSPPPTVIESRCSKTQFECGDGSCIKLKLKCDSDIDCPDGSDESPSLCLAPTTTTTTTTTRAPCPGGQFQCVSDGSCIKGKLKCDEDVDCLDGSDEDPRICSNALVSPPNENVKVNEHQVKTKALDDQEHENQAESGPEPEPTDTFDFPLGSRTQENDEIIFEAKRIIQAGDEQLDLNDRVTDVILMLGNSGSGKTTLTKLLTSPDLTDLESYWAGERFSIRDKEGQISSGRSTVVSRTIFPKLVINPKTNTAFYDLPGFSDTRGPAVDLANAMFLTRVTERARRVKLILVVNYSSLKSGEVRSDFRNLLDSLTDFVRSPMTKFRPVVALIANKVDLDTPGTIALAGVAKFLQDARTGLSSIFPDDPSKAENARILLDSLLLKDRRGYLRLGYMKQPDAAGSLADSPTALAAKAALSKMIGGSLRTFVAKTSDDFGLSVSPSTKLWVMNGKRNIQWNVGQFVDAILYNVRQRFIQLVDGDEDLWGLYSNFQNGFDLLRNTTDAIRSLGPQEKGTGKTGVKGNGGSASEKWKWNTQKLLRILKDLVEELNFNLDPSTNLGGVFKNLEDNLNNLDFLQSLQIKQSPKIDFEANERILKSWMRPLESAARDIQNSLYKMSGDVNKIVNGLFHYTTDQVMDLYKGRVKRVNDLMGSGQEEAEEEFSQLVQLMESDGGLLEDLPGTLKAAQTVQRFLNETQNTLIKLGVGVSPELIQLFDLPLYKELRLGKEEEEFDGNSVELAFKPSPYFEGRWVEYIEDLKERLKEEKRELQDSERNDREDAEVGRVRDRLENLQNTYEEEAGDLRTEVNKAEVSLAGMERRMKGIVQRELEVLDVMQAEVHAVRNGTEISSGGSSE